MEEEKLGDSRSLQSIDVTAKKEKMGGGANGASELPNWENGREWDGGGERGSKGGDGVFSPLAELMVERARRARRWLGLFIGRLGRCPSGEIFLMAMLIHHIRSHHHG
jgi:hypothetical protein